MPVSDEVNPNAALWPRDFDLGYSSKRREKHIPTKKVFMQMFIAVNLLVKAPNWKQPKCPSAERLIAHSHKEAPLSNNRKHDIYATT